MSRMDDRVDRPQLRGRAEAKGVQTQSLLHGRGARSENEPNSRQSLFRPDCILRNGASVARGMMIFVTNSFAAVFAVAALGIGLSAAYEVARTPPRT